MGKNFYAVKVGREPGIYKTWFECSAQIDKFPKAIFKGFQTKQEADNFLSGNSNRNQNNKIPQIRPITDQLYKRILPKTNIREDVIKRRFESFQNNRNYEVPQTFSNSYADQEVIRRLKDIFNSPNYKRPEKYNQTGLELSPAMRTQCGRYLDLSYDWEDSERVIVYTKGYCTLSPDYFTIAGFGVFWARNCFLNEECKYSDSQDSYHADVAAVMRAVESAHKCGIRRLFIKTESSFTLMKMAEWVEEWSDSQWNIMDKYVVKCRAVVEKLARLLKDTGINIKWSTKEDSNDGDDAFYREVDRLAKNGAYMWNNIEIL